LTEVRSCLSVREQEDCMLVIFSGSAQDILEIFMPFVHSITFADFDLKSTWKYSHNKILAKQQNMRIHSQH